MKLLCGLFLFVSVIRAAQLPDQLLRLIGPNARAVAAIDVAKYQMSALAGFYPNKLPLEAYGLTIWQTIEVLDGQSMLMIFQGPLPALQAFPYVRDQARGALLVRRGVQMISDGSWTLAWLNPTTAIAGQASIVDEAMDRWSNPSGAIHGVAARVKELSAAFDNWLLLVKPLESRDILNRNSKYAQDLSRTVEEVRGGVRLGAFNDFHVDVQLSSTEDAAALAALAHILPAVIPPWVDGAVDRALIDLAESVDTRATGNVVTWSFLLPEERLRELSKRQPVQ